MEPVTDHDRLIALLEGLEVRNINTLMIKEPEVFRALGRYLAYRFKGMPVVRDFTMNDLVDTRRN